MADPKPSTLALAPTYPRKGAEALRRRSRVPELGGNATHLVSRSSPTIIVIDADLGFASSLARLAEHHQISLSLFWSEDTLDAIIDHDHVGAAIIDYSEWLRLRTFPSTKIRSFLDTIPTILIDPRAGASAQDTPENTANIVARMTKSEGAARVLEAAVKACPVHKRPILGGSHHDGAHGDALSSRALRRSTSLDDDASTS